MRRAAWIGCVLWVGCKAPPPAVDASEYEGSQPLNPKVDGQWVYRSYGHHHPTCYIMTAGGEAEDVACPKGALQTLESCPGGKLFTSHQKACVCVRLSGDPPPARVDCH